MGFVRILLGISIVFSHAGKPFGYDMIPTKTAIQAFFIISGFYMALILNEKYASQKNSYKLFITNRFLRIFPLYWFMLLCIIGADFFRCHKTLATCYAFPVGNTIFSSALLGGQYA